MAPKIIILILVFLLSLIPFTVNAQDGMVHTWTDSVTLDSSATQVLYLGFYSRSGPGTSGLSSSAITPKNGVKITDDLLITGYIDSLKASTALDSIYGYVQSLDKDGYPLSDTLFFDFTNNDSTNAIQYLNSFTPFNRSTPTLGTTAPTFWIDLTGLMRAVHGLKITTVHVGIGSTNDSLRVVYNMAQGLKNYKD